MTSPYILRKGVSGLNDLVDGVEAKLSAGVGKVIYVNGVTWANGFVAGDDGNSGLSMDEPVHTLTHALALCTNEGNDAIILLDYYQPTAETWPVTISKSVVSIYGISSTPMHKWICMYASGSYPCLDITGSHVYIEGIAFYPNSSKACVTFDDGCGWIHFNDCSFEQGTCGIDMDAADTSTSIAITNCYFTASLSAGGIDVDDDPAFLMIDGNRFDALTGDCINITAGAGHQITNNFFSMKAATSGLAITLGTGVSRAFVSGNHAGYGANNSSISPYDDEGTVTTNHWGTNFYGSAVADPA
jgi:hypothetical protein